MARRFLSGALVGTLVGVGAAGIASITAGPPAAPDVAVDAPTTGEAPIASRAADAQSATDSDLALDAGVAKVAEPQADDVGALADAGTDTTGRPETGVVPGLAVPQPAEDTAGVQVGTDAPVLPSPQAASPTQPDAETELSISTEPAQPPAPTVEDETAFVPVPPVPEAPEVAKAPEPPADPAPSDTTTVAPQAAATETPSQTPRIEQRAGSLVDRDDAPEPAAPIALVGPAIDAYAADFKIEPGKPLMSIVLIDTGADLAGGTVGLAALRSFPYPLSFAIDANLPDAAMRAAAFRAEGFEVLAMIDLPVGATPSDAEVSLAAALDAVPEAVGILEGVGTGIQSDRETSDQVTSILASSGHGILMQSKGLNTAQKLAVRDGVPAATVFRDFDSADQTPTVIRRFLDQAAFRADQEGGVVMMGRVRPDTISALLLWGLQDRAERVALAPVSAVLKAQVAE